MNGIFMKEQRDGLVGIEPIKDVITLENHHEAYLVWQKRGIKNKILVHIDAHIDFGWIPDKDPKQIIEVQTKDELERLIKAYWLWNPTSKKKEDWLGIGNYICPAIRDNIVRELYWVVPDKALNDSKQRRRLEDTLRQLISLRNHRFNKIALEKEYMVTEVSGKKVTLCSLAGLPEFSEGVLLDIDIDFLITPSILKDISPDRRPWILPEQLIDRLKEKRIRSGLVTIAYSVEGGFTPLRYKHFGNDLQMMIGNPVLDGSLREVISCRNRAMLYEYNGGYDEAIAEYHAVLKLDPQDVSSYYNLARLYLKKGWQDMAVFSYQEAIRVNPTYKTAYNNYGPIYENLGSLEEAEREYKETLLLNPQDANAYCGLGNLFAKKKRWGEAASKYRRSIELQMDNPHSHYGLGYVYLKMGRLEEAVDEFKRCIALRQDKVEAHYWLGYIHSKKCRTEEAILEYKKAIRLGLFAPMIYLHLAGLYLRKGLYYKAMNECKKSLRLLIPSIILRLKRLWNGLKRL